MLFMHTKKMFSNYTDFALLADPVPLKEYDTLCGGGKRRKGESSATDRESDVTPVAKKALADCPICLDTISDDACFVCENNHQFHCECIADVIASSLVSSNNCPICRKPLCKNATKRHTKEDKCDPPVLGLFDAMQYQPSGAFSPIDYNPNNPLHDDVKTGFTDYLTYNEYLNVVDDDGDAPIFDRDEILSDAIIGNLREKISSEVYTNVRDLNINALTDYITQPLDEEEHIFGVVNDQNRTAFMNYVKTNVDHQTEEDITTYHQWAMDHL